jgi:Glycosyltransferase 61
VIGFLNRADSKQGRHCDNHELVVQALQKHDFGFSEPPQIKYLDSFDGLSFQEQITFMSQIDILIGPHGAQVTSAAFVPTCGGVVEFIPKGYYYPSFFGSLSQSTGHYYRYIYLGNFTNRMQEWEYWTVQDGKRRGQAKKWYTTVNPEAVVMAVKELTAEWQQCCQRGSRPFG